MNGDTQGPEAVLVVTPVLNDWESLGILLARLDEALAARGVAADVLAVDDGSEVGPEGALELGPLSAIGSVCVLRLRRNVGHQRAIAIALAYAEANLDYRAALIMDSDGEDTPEAALALLEEADAGGRPEVVFARRAKRSEGFGFRVFYRAYLWLFAMLTGKDGRVGNLSVVPFPLLGRIVVLSELWNHYAAAIMKSRVPHRSIPLARGRRYAGRSRMGFVSLVMHGLSAISVYMEIVGVRLIIALLGVGGVAAVGIVVVAAIRLATDLAIPGWASSIIGLCVVVLLQAATLAFVLAMLTLSSRSNLAFIPLRDYEYFVLDVTARRPLGAEPASALAFRRAGRAPADAGRTA